MSKWLTFWLTFTLGGIYAGIFTPTESAAVGTVYALVLGFLTKELKIKDLPRILKKSAETSAMVNIIIAVANILSLIMAAARVTPAIVSFLQMFISDKYTYLFVMNLFLLFVGAILDQGAAVIIICPTIYSLGISLGLQPLHLAVVMVINLVLGNVTPPFGYNLFTGCSVSGLKFNEVVKGLVPFLIVEILALFLFSYFPILVTWLPTLAGYK